MKKNNNKKFVQGYIVFWRIKNEDISERVFEQRVDAVHYKNKLLKNKLDWAPHGHPGLYER